MIMPKKFVFRTNQIIGAAAAEFDDFYLSKCFIDNGDLDIMRNCNDPRHILIGRTGSGKSALIHKLSDVEDHVIFLRTESLALAYISNSNILRFFAEAGVKLDIFYRLLWRHIFCVEILKERFNITNEDSKKSFLDRLWAMIPRNKQNELALDYLRTWGESFWKETEFRVQEVTSKLERSLESSVEGSIPPTVSLKGGVATKLTEEQRNEIIHRGQEVVNQVQIRELSTVMDLIDDVLLSDRQQRYFITIDKLDEDWIEDSLRFHLIRALIETGLDFCSRIKNVKIIIAIRSDLLDRVYRYTRDPGFQEEKYRTSSLDITWTRSQLVDVLDSRISLLIRNQYTTHTVSYSDILSIKVGKRTAIDYMLDRTFLRPRDIIQFFNACINQSDGKAKISRNALLAAEGIYSRERLRALFDEWYGLYPNLEHLYLILVEKNKEFLLDSVTDVELQENLLSLLVSGKGRPGIDLDLMKDMFDNNIDIHQYRKSIVHILYKVSLIGLKIAKGFPISWSYSGGSSISISEINMNTRIIIHPMFFRVLGTTSD
jgi:hypothetical protein